MLGSGEVAVIALLALLLFGPEKLPELARSVGRAYTEFKNAQEEVERQINREILEKKNIDIEEDIGLVDKKDDEHASRRI
jgi:TatA/E family protein of Tat protein translocase